MGFFDKLLKRNTEGIAVPQYFNDDANDYEAIKGSNGAILTKVTNDDASAVPMKLTGSFVRLSTDPKPQGKEGDTLYLWDTKEAYIHDGTDWRLL
jgi:hypothetical protein